MKNTIATRFSTALIVGYAFVLSIQSHSAFADSVTATGTEAIAPAVTTTWTTTGTGKTESTLVLKDFLRMYFDTVASIESVPSSYKYIEVRYKNVEKGSQLYESLQKGIYMDFFPNKALRLPLESPVYDTMLVQLLKKNFDRDMLHDPKNPKPVTKSLLKGIFQELYADQESDSDSSQQDSETPTGDSESDVPYDSTEFTIFRNVFVTLRDQTFSGVHTDEKKMLQGAIKWMAEALGDKYTEYMPPVESQDFQEEIGGAFEGIGAYVDLSASGQVMIVSPIKGSPADSAGLKKGDVILSVNGKSLSGTTNVADATRLIKWPRGTKVRLLIERLGIQKEYEIVRERVEIEYVTLEFLRNSDALLSIKTFGDGTAKKFNEALQKIDANVLCNKIILDLRGNPGGSLAEVTNMLDSFVPLHEPSVVVHSNLGETKYISYGNSNITRANKLPIVILVDGFSASASEVMAGTLRDYLGKNVQIVGTKTYGKWSVQNVKNYVDGSLLKYTIALWYTGKTLTSVNHNGIVPDTVLPFDDKRYVSDGYDNQLEYAKSLSLTGK